MATTRDPALDLLRAIAVLLVVAAHTGSFMPLEQFPRLPAALAGSLGVEMFFSLSGFLIARILLAQEGTGFTWPAARRFIARRWLRTLPLWYAFLVVLALFGWHISPHDWVLGHGFVPAIAWHLRHAWSLGVEELFYLALPLAVLALGGGRGSVARAAGFALVLGFTLRLCAWLGASPQGFELELFRTNPVFRIDAAAPGVLAACWLHRHPAPGPAARGVLLAMALALAALVQAATALMFALGPAAHPVMVSTLVGTYHVALLPLLNLAAALAVVALAGALPRWRPATALARWSYGIYLFHLPIFTVTGPLAEGTRLAGLPAFALSLALSVALAALSWRWFERPILAWRDRHLPAPRATPLAHPVAIPLVPAPPPPVPRLASPASS